MAWNRSTPKQMLARIQALFDVYLPGSDSRLRYSPELIFARAVAMAKHEMDGYLEWMSRQILPDTADDDNLERHGTLKRVRRKGAAPAAGKVSFAGTNGTVIFAGSTLRRSDQREYVTAADITIAGGAGTGTVTAVLGGIDGNAAIGTKLTLTSPVQGAISGAQVIDDGSGQGLTGGADVESDDELRARILERWQKPPQGGAKSDYEEWAKEFPGVTRSWVYSNQLGLGTVVVVVVMDNKPGTIVPSEEEVAAVQGYINGVRPVTAEVTVLAPITYEIPFDISISPNTAAIQNAIAAELADFLKREGIPGGTLPLSRIDEAISAAPGEFEHRLNSPAETQIVDFAQIPLVGEISWSDL